MDLVSPCSVLSSDWLNRVIWGGGVYGVRLKGHRAGEVCLMSRGRKSDRCVREVLLISYERKQRDVWDERKGGDAQGHTRACHVCVDGCVCMSVADGCVHTQAVGMFL